MKNIYKVFLIGLFMVSCYWLSKQHTDIAYGQPFSNIRTTIVGSGGSPLILYAWNGPSNVITLNNTFWFFSGNSSMAITNVAGISNGFATWVTLVQSNTGPGDVISYSTVPFARSIGAQTHNPIDIPPGKVCIWSWLSVGGMSTNFVNSVQDAVSSASGVSLVAAGTNIYIITNAGLATISLKDPTIVNELDVANLYGTNFFTLLTNYPFLKTDGNGQLADGVELPGTNVLLSPGQNVSFTTNPDGTIVIASTSTNTINTITNNLLVTTNIIVYSNLTVLQNLYVSTNFSTNLYSTTAYITNLYTSIAYITNLYSSTAYITNLYTSIAYITNLYSSTAFITNLYSSIAYITNLYSSTAFITNLYASTNFSTNLYFLSGKGNTLIITNNLNLDYLVINKLLATDGAKNVTNADVSARFTFTGNVLDIAAGSVPNSDLQNSSLTIAGTANQVSVSGGGPVSLGGTATLSLPSPVVAPGLVYANGQFVTNILPSSIVAPTNGVSSASAVDFSVIEATTNIAGAVSFTSLSNFNPTNYNRALRHIINRTGSDQTITVGTWETDANRQTATTYIATNNTTLELMFSMQVNVFTNVMSGKTFR